MFWLAEVAQVIGSPEPYVRTMTFFLCLLLSRLSFVCLVAVLLSPSCFLFALLVQAFQGWHDKADAQQQQQSNRGVHLHCHQSESTSFTVFLRQWGRQPQWSAWRLTENIHPVGALAGEDMSKDLRYWVSDKTRMSTFWFWRDKQITSDDGVN